MGMQLPLWAHCLFWSIMFKSIWSDENLKKISEMIHTYSNREIAEYFSVSKGSMDSCISYRGFKRTPEEIHNINSRCTSERNKNQIGDKNPNWKGGISTNAYRYKKVQAKRFPEKNKARRKVRYAIKTGKLIKQPCEFCGETEVFAHHDDYSKPLEVRWVCRSCHRYKLHDGKH